MKPLNCRFGFPPPDRSNSESSIWFRILEALVEALIIYIAFKRCRLLTFWGEKRAAAPDLAFAKSIGRIRVDQPHHADPELRNAARRAMTGNSPCFMPCAITCSKSPINPFEQNPIIPCATPDRLGIARTRASHRAQRRARCSEWQRTSPSSPACCSGPRY